MAYPDSARQPPPISKATLRFFRFIVRGYFRRHFRAVLVQQAHHLRSQTGPLIVYGNHASWWDPMAAILLAHVFLPHRKHYAPMDAVPLARYRIFRKLGIFPVDLSSPRGAVQFLRTAQSVLESGGVLWITPQGRFADVRERPLAFREGLAALAARTPQAALVPLAVEYTFWDERLPEALVRIGPPAKLDLTRPKAELTHQLEAALEATMDALSAAALQRNPALFDAVLEGRRGTGGFYALARNLRGLFVHRGLQQDHTARDAKPRVQS